MIMSFAPGEDILPENLEIDPKGRLSHVGVQNYVPLSRKLLDSMLLSDYGLGDSERLRWARFFDALGRVQRAQMFLNWDLLRELYQPFDPDHTYLSEEHPAPGEDKADRLDIFIRQFEEALRAANFQRVEFDVIQHAVRSNNDLRLKYEPNFDVFDEIRVYGRGRCIVTRPRRTLRRGWRKEMHAHHAWHRLVVMVKFRDGVEMGPMTRSDRIYLRIFKEVPFRELEMHLPEQATRIRMPMLDKVSVASPVLVGLPTLVSKVLSLPILALMNPLVLGSLLTVPVASGWRSFSGFRNAKLKHTHRMITNLFYLTQGNNRLCITRICEMGWEQENAEAAIAFKMIHDANARGESIDAATLDHRAERFVHDVRQIRIDFQCGDAVEKLRRLGLLKSRGMQPLEVLPLDEAMEVLRKHWARMSP
ncbi:DUF3754 domain-containing protein [bacterium]|nr:DUF3754 domain-containing protein [bacterium]